MGLENEILYVMGGLRNKKIPLIAKKLRKLGFKEVFDDWYSPGPHADDYWRKFEKIRGSTYKQALKNWAAKHIFEFDTHHINRSTMGLLVMKAGRSCHLELGYLIGQGKKGYVLFDKEPKRWDIMYQFCEEVFFSEKEMMEYFKRF